MKKQLTISIIIPAYNEEGYLGDCLDSLKAQSLQPDEIIVVDNNSEDRTAEIAKSYDGVKVVSEHTQGRGAARRTGFDEATGDVLVRIDADSVLKQGWLQTILDNFLEDEISAWTGRIGIHEGANRKLNTVISNFGIFTANRWISGHNITFGANMAISRKVWKLYKHEIRDSDEIWEDLEIACVLNNHGIKTSLEKKILCDISIRALNVSPRFLYHRLSGWYKTYKPHNKRAYILSIPSAWISWLIWTILGPVTKIGYKPK